MRKNARILLTWPEACIVDDMHGTTSTISLGKGPLYKRVKGALTQWLASGKWKPNEAIPSEGQLAKQFDVSLGTVRKAIDELAAERILIRQQGRGTFVASHTEQRFLFHFYHVVDENGVKRFPSPELLSFRRERAEPAVAERLGLARGARVIHVRNLLRIQGVPVEVDDLYISSETFKGLKSDTFANRPGTIYQLYQERYGINIIRTSERLRAISVKAVEAELLGLEVGAPVLEIARTAYTYSERPIEFRRCQVNTTHHVYQSDIES
jgi:GntR family transcriptional regulator